MANQNLSQFGEKLFVADADHTFIWDSAASISKRVSRNSWLNSGTLTSDAPVTISQTWNNAAVAFTGLKVNAVSTASASGSLLLDLQVGGVTQLSVTKAGAVNVTGAVSTPAQFIAGDAIFANGNGVRYVSTWIRSAGFDGGLLFRNNTQTQSVGVVVEADNTLALRNGAAAQTFRVYKSYLNAGVDYERLSFSHDGVQFGIGTERAGSGIAQPLRFFGGSSAALDFANGVSFRNASGGTTFMTVASSGNVGIGTTAPGAKLQVVGNAIFGENVASATINNVSFGGSYGTSTPGNKANLKWDLYNDAVLANRFGIGMSAGLMEFQAGAGGGFGFYPANTTVSALHIIGSGNVGIGTTSPTSKLHVAGDVTLPNGGSIFFGGGFNIYGTTTSTTINGPTAFGILNVASNGVTKWTFNYDGLLCGGGTTAAFPALKRSSTTMQARLADDTAFAPIQGKLTTDTAFTATTVTPTGFITLYDSTGTAYKVPCVPA